MHLQVPGCGKFTDRSFSVLLSSQEIAFLSSIPSRASFSPVDMAGTINGLVSVLLFAKWPHAVKIPRTHLHMRLAFPFLYIMCRTPVAG
jgi:hypothetical protein